MSLNTQLELSSKTISNDIVINIRIPSYQYLPEGLDRLIFSNLRGEEAAAASRVCKNWHKIAREKSLWKEICDREFIAVADEGSLKNYIQAYSTRYLRYKEILRANQQANQENEARAKAWINKERGHKVAAVVALGTLAWSIAVCVQTIISQNEIYAHDSGLLENALNSGNYTVLGLDSSCRPRNSTCVDLAQNAFNSLLEPIKDQHSKGTELPVLSTLYVLFQGIKATGLFYKKADYEKCVKDKCDRALDIVGGSLSGLVAYITYERGIFSASVPSFVTGGMLIIQGVFSRKKVNNACGTLTDRLKSVYSRISSLWRS